MEDYLSYAVLAMSDQLASRLKAGLTFPKDIVLARDSVSLIYGGSVISKIRFFGQRGEPTSAVYTRRLSESERLRALEAKLSSTSGCQLSEQELIIRFENISLGYISETIRNIETCLTS